MELKEIIGKSITLVPLSKEYIDKYLAQFSSQVKQALDVEDHQSEREYLHYRIDQDSFFYLIIDKKTEKLIGAIEIREPGYQSQLYCWINEQFWSQGYFQESLQLLLPYYKKITNENHIKACVNSNNERSFKALQKAGFAIVGMRDVGGKGQYLMEIKI